MNMSNDQKTHARFTLKSSLVKRVATPDVAKAILDLGVAEVGSDLHKELTDLSYDAGNGMNDDFDRVVPVQNQLSAFTALFPTVNVDSVKGLNVYAANYVSAYRETIAIALATLGVAGAAGDVYKNRYSYTPLTGVSKKAFVKRLRYLAFFEDKVNRIEQTLQLRHAQMQAKSRLAYKIDADVLDDVTLSYVAYVAARANRRSLFMLGGQSKAFDTVSGKLKEMLPETAAWDQVAYVTPVTEVFAKLSDAKLGELAIEFHGLMVESAVALGKMWPSLPARMREEMVMVKGVDSGSWNAYAGAFNTMRSAWVSVMLKAGLGDVFAVYLPGKAPRLMASDLVWWARERGQELHEDTRLFAKLPKPWEVVEGSMVDGGTVLTLQGILDAIEELKVPAALESGWVGPRAKKDLEISAAEPASVHGVVVANASLAHVLRKAKVFSGKQATAKSGELRSLLTVEMVNDEEKTYPVYSL